MYYETKKKLFEWGCKDICERVNFIWSPSSCQHNTTDGKFFSKYSFLSCPTKIPISNSWRPKCSITHVYESMFWLLRAAVTRIIAYHLPNPNKIQTAPQTGILTFDPKFVFSICNQNTVKFESESNISIYLFMSLYCLFNTVYLIHLYLNERNSFSQACCI